MRRFYQFQAVRCDKSHPGLLTAGELYTVIEVSKCGLTVLVKADDGVNTPFLASNFVDAPIVKHLY